MYTSTEKIVIDDLIVLGNAVPDEISDNRKTVCTAGFSEKYGLVRVYPVPTISNMKRWNVVRIPLERNPKDTRVESWKIQGSKSEWDILASKIELKRKLRRNESVDLIERLKAKYSVQCVEELNENKLSLGIVKPKSFSPFFQKRKDYDSTVQKSLFGNEPFLTIHNYAIQPRMKYTCSSCKAKGSHDQQILEWGVYEWIRQHPNEIEKVWKNLHIGEEDYDMTFLIGNMTRYRNSFVIISLFRFKKNEEEETSQGQASLDFRPNL